MPVAERDLSVDGVASKEARRSRCARWQCPPRPRVPGAALANRASACGRSAARSLGHVDTNEHSPTAARPSDTRSLLVRTHRFRGALRADHRLAHRERLLRGRAHARSLVRCRDEPPAEQTRTSRCTWSRFSNSSHPRSWGLRQARPRITTSHDSTCGASSLSRRSSTGPHCQAALQRRMGVRRTCPRPGPLQRRPGSRRSRADAPHGLRELYAGEAVRRPRQLRHGPSGHQAAVAHVRGVCGRSDGEQRPSTRWTAGSPRTPIAVVVEIGRPQSATARSTAGSVSSHTPGSSKTKGCCPVKVDLLRRRHRSVIPGEATHRRCSFRSRGVAIADRRESRELGAREHDVAAP